MEPPTRTDDTEHNQCSAKRAIPILDYFGAPPIGLNNMVREVDLRSVPGGELYVYRTGLCVVGAGSWFSNLPKASIDTCTEPVNTYVAFREGAAMTLQLGVYEVAPHISTLHGYALGVAGFVTLSEDVT